MNGKRKLFEKWDPHANSTVPVVFATYKRLRESEKEKAKLISCTKMVHGIANIEGYPSASILHKTEDWLVSGLVLVEVIFSFIPVQFIA